MHHVRGFNWILFVLSFFKCVNYSSNLSFFLLLLCVECLQQTVEKFVLGEGGQVCGVVDMCSVRRQSHMSTRER